MEPGGQEGGVCPPPPDFDRSEVATGQWWRASLLLAHSYFQSFCHPWALKGILHLLKLKDKNTTEGVVHILSRCGQKKSTFIS